MLFRSFAVWARDTTTPRQRAKEQKVPLFALPQDEAAGEEDLFEIVVCRHGMAICIALSMSYEADHTQDRHVVSADTLIPRTRGSASRRRVLYNRRYVGRPRSAAEDAQQDLQKRSRLVSTSYLPLLIRSEPEPGVRLCTGKRKRNRSI